MNTVHDGQFMLAQLVRLVKKEADYLGRTTVRLRSQNIDLAWVKSLEDNDGRSEMLDAFVSRYSRLQDSLGDKLLRAMLIANLEKTGSQLDNLLRAEKLIPNVAWQPTQKSWFN